MRSHESDRTLVPTAARALISVARFVVDEIDAEHSRECLVHSRVEEERVPALVDFRRWDELLMREVRRHAKECERCLEDGRRMRSKSASASSPWGDRCAIAIDCMTSSSQLGLRLINERRVGPSDSHPLKMSVFSCKNRVKGCPLAVLQKTTIV